MSLRQLGVPFSVLAQAATMSGYPALSTTVPLCADVL